MKKLLYIYFIASKFLFLIVYSLIPREGKFYNYLRLKLENRIIFSPRIKSIYPIDKELLKDIEVVKIMTPDCVKLHSWFFRPQNNNPVIVFCHGQSENISMWQDTAKFIKTLGYGALFLSYRGHYKSAGLPSEKGIYTDAESAIDYLNSQGIKTENTIFWGRSLGSTIVCEMARKYNLKAIIIESGITNIKSAAITLSETYLNQGNINFIKPLVSKLWNNIHFVQNFENNKKISKVECPTLIIHSTNDVKIPCCAAEELFSCKPDAKFKLMNIGCHDSNDWCYSEIEDFLAKVSAQNKDLVATR